MSPLRSRRPANRRAPGALLALALTCLPSALTAQDPPPTRPGSAVDEGSMGRIVVVLYDGVTGAPISEALVTLDAISRRTLSDSAGSAFSGVTGRCGAMATWTK